MVNSLDREKSEDLFALLKVVFWLAIPLGLALLLIWIG
jgi:hypothetical protein